MDSDDTAPKLALLPSRLLQRAALAASRVVTVALDEVGGHRYEFAVLITLEHAGPCSQATLCRRTGIDRSDVTAVVSDLEAAGHIMRTEDPVDRRRNLVRLQRQGRDRLATLETTIAAAHDELLAGWTATEQDRLVTLLGRVIDRSAV